MEPVDEQSHGLGLDPASLLMAGEDPAAAVLAWGDRLASARLVDLTGEGIRTVPFAGGAGPVGPGLVQDLAWTQPGWSLRGR